MTQIRVIKQISLSALNTLTLLSKISTLFFLQLRADKICFALRCKSFFAIYTQQKNLRFVLRLNSTVDETDLRLRLQKENRRIYCTQCSEPHWCSVWHTLRSCLNLNTKLQVAVKVIKSGIAFPSRGKLTFVPVILWHSININFSHIYVGIQLLPVKPCNGTFKVVLILAAMNNLSNSRMNVLSPITNW